jgi:putative ABC transport system permease protein
VSILTLTLGIGASTAIFSVVYGVLLRPLPYKNPGQIVRLWELSGKGTRMSFAHPNFVDLRNQSHSLQEFAEFAYGIDSVSSGSDARRTGSAYVSHGFFKVMGVQPVMGRIFIPEEERPHGASAALVSYSFWHESLGAASDLSSVQIKVENKPTSIVGVLPPGFHFPEDTQIWMSNGLQTQPASRTAHNWKVVGRLRDGASLDQARTELDSIAYRIKQQYGQDVDMVRADVVPLRDALTENTRPALLILMGVSGLLLLVACANVMNLMLAQAAARQTELGVRSALGASRGRLVRQFLTESLVLCLAGGAAGVALSFWGVRGLLALGPRNIPRLDDVSINWPVLLFALAISAIVAAGLGVATALRATAGDVQSRLAEGGRVQGTGAVTQRAGRVIIALQMAATVVLLVGAGLLGRSFLRILSIDPGFRTEGVLTLDLALPETAGQKQQRVELISRILDRLRALPGVSEIGSTNALPLGSRYSADGTFALVNPTQLSAKAQELIQRSANFTGEPTAEDFKALDEFFDPLFHDKEHTGHADYVVASEGYFRVLGISLKRGRFFTAADTINAPHVALISESLARRVWPDRDPIGESIEFGNMDGDLRLLTIVGVVSDVRDSSLETPPQPTVYVTFRQRPAATSQFSVVMRSAADPSSTMSAARRIINEVDPTIPVKPDTFTRVFAASLSVRRFNLTLVTIFSATALLLAIAGIYGVLAYSVERRTRELGVRIALGASAANVIRLVLRQAVMTTLAGIAIGAVAAFALTRLMQSMVFEISTADPVTYAGIGVLLLAAALAAAAIPARRATRVDPMVALRTE